MTKDQYFEMCDVMGSEPIEEEIPVEYEDLLTDVQDAFNIYSKLRDEWDGMNGVYLGKNFSGIMDIFDLYEISKEDRRLMFDILNTIDNCRSKIINDKQKEKKK
jgi:hypothetical protein